jgi:hypothetical protein
VLTSLVAAGKYPEPLYGRNNLQIPESLCRTAYWYRTEFAVPAVFRGRHVRLNFDGVNYAAEVWINGHPLGEIPGAFIRGQFDVSQWVRPGGRAAVAVKILPPAHPGTPHEQSVAGGVGPNGGPMGADGATWESLTRYEIREALPTQPPPLRVRRPVDLGDGLWWCGDHRDTASIQGALVSGRRTAERLLRERT